MKEDYFTKKNHRYSQKMIEQSAIKTEYRQNQQLESQYQTPCTHKTYKNQSAHDYNMQSSKIDLIKDLLHTLKYKTTNQIFQKERNKIINCRNPQNSIQKIKLSHKNKKTKIEKSLEKAIYQSKSFEEMISLMEGIVKTSNKQQKMIEENNISNQHQTGNIEKAIQEIFTEKQTATIPIFKSLQIQYPNKQIKLIDIDINENVCFIDNQHNLYLIKAQEEEKAISIKLDQKKHIINLKWVNSQVIILLSANNKILFYQTSKLGLLRTIKHYKIQIHLSEIYTFNTEKIKDKTTLYILSVSQQKFIPLKLSCKEKEIHVEGESVFDQKFQIKAITMVKVPHSITFHRKLDEGEEPTEIVISTEIQHFYGLAKNCKSIVKYDSVVEKSGIIWQSSDNYTIWELNCSKCGYFLTALIVLQPQHQYQDNFSQLQPFTFVKMNGDGCIIQKINFHLTNMSKILNYGKQIFYNFQNILKSNIKWNQLEPQWLRCYVYNNRLIYLSTRSGNIIYSQQLQGNDIKIRSVGPTNSLLFQIDKRLLMYSTKQTKKRKIILQNKRSNQFRQSIIQRFARLQGVPQNLLILLRSIRNHDLNFMENP